MKNKTDLQEIVKCDDK